MLQEQSQPHFAVVAAVVVVVVVECKRHCRNGTSTGIFRGGIGGACRLTLDYNRTTL
jgi:hypothetical protein